MESSKPRALAAFAAAEGRSGILVDFDGSLSPIVARPELAQIREGARDALARLVGRFAVVAVVSGRTRAELETLIGVPGVRLAALYGIEDDTMLPEGLEDRVRAIAAGIPGIRVEHKGGSIAAHYRGASDPAAAEASLADGARPDRRGDRDGADRGEEGPGARPGRPAAEGRCRRADRGRRGARRRALRGRRPGRPQGVRGARPRWRQPGS